MNETKKVSMFTKLNYIFDKKQKGQLILLAVLILIGGVVETLGVSMMLPVVSAILKPEAIHRQIDKRPELQSIVNFLHIDTDLKLITVLVVVVIFLFVFKNLYLLFLVYKQNTFISRARNDMISRVMREFLNRPYEAYLGADIPTVFRITDSDIPKTFTLMLSILSLATEFVVSTCLGIVLLLVNWQMTLLMIFVLLILTLIITKVLKPRLNRIGRKNQETQSRIAKWRLQAIYGLKDVKVLNRQDFFIRNYYEQGRIGKAKKTISRVLTIDRYNPTAMRYLREMGESEGDIIRNKDEAGEDELFDGDYYGVSAATEDGKSLADYILTGAAPAETLPFLVALEKRDRGEIAALLAETAARLTEAAKENPSVLAVLDRLDPIRAACEFNISAGHLAGWIASVL